MRAHRAYLAGLILSAAGWGTAAAQAPPLIGPPPLTPSTRPTVSPYLDLAVGNGFGGPAYQYFRQLRPEVALRRTNIGQAAALRTLEEQLDAQRQMLQSPESALGPTGHRTSFLNYGSYFPAAPTARLR